MKVTVAATQFACTENREENLASAERMIRAAAAAMPQHNEFIARNFRAFRRRLAV